MPFAVAKLTGLLVPALAGAAALFGEATIVRPGIAGTPPVADSPTIAAPGDTVRVSFVDGTSTISVTVRPDGRLDTAVTLIVKNGEDAAVIGRTTLAFVDSNSGTNTASIACCPTPHDFPPGYAPLRLELRAALPAGHTFVGYMVTVVDSIHGRAGSRLTRPIRVSVAAPTHAAQEPIVLVGLVGGAIWLIAGLGRILAKKPYGSVLQASWTAADSWASNFTMLGQAVALIFAAATPSVSLVLMSRNEYAALTSLLSAIVLLAPAIYGFLKGVLSSPAGSRVAFVLAGAFTVVGAFAQLVLVSVLVWDIRGGAGIGASAFGLTATLAVVALLSLAAFAVRSLITATDPTPAVPALKRSSMTDADGTSRDVILHPLL